MLSGVSNVTPPGAGPNVPSLWNYSFGLPVGMSFIGKANSEATLLKLAYAYERAAKPRRAPRFLPTADLTSP